MTPTAVEAFLLLESTGRRFPLADGQSWAIGRGDGCAVMLDSRSVSRLHALIQRNDGGDIRWWIWAAATASFVNARRVSLPLLLNDKDRLVFGDQELIFRNPLAANSRLEARKSLRATCPTTALQTQSLTTIVVVDIRDFTPLARKVPEALLSQTIGTWFLRADRSLSGWGAGRRNISAMP